MTHGNHRGWKQLFAALSEQSARPAVAHRAAWGRQRERLTPLMSIRNDELTRSASTLNAEQVLAGVHGQAGRVTG